jgi:flagellar motor protein MotB
MRAFLVAPLLLIGATASCGRTELEWNSKVREVESLNARLNKTNQDKIKTDEEMAKLQEDNSALRAEASMRLNDAMKSPERLAMLDRAAREKEAVEAMKGRVEMLRKKLEPLAKEGVTVGVRRNQLTVTIPGELLFGKGNDLSGPGKEALRTIGGSIGADAGLGGRLYLVAAHEIPGEKEPGAIGRSQSKAAAVREFLVARKGGLPPARWSSAGRGVIDPLLPDEMADSKDRNYRVELIMLPEPNELADLSRITF